MLDPAHLFADMMTIRTELKTSTIPGAGSGLFVVEDHPRGQVIGRFDPANERLYTWDEIKDDPELLDKCYFDPDYDRYVFSNDHSRFINHSCDRYNYVTNAQGENVLIRDVRVGEELFANYCAWPGMDQRLIQEMVGASACACPFTRGRR